MAYVAVAGDPAVSPNPWPVDPVLEVVPLSEVDPLLEPPRTVEISSNAPPESCLSADCHVKGHLQLTAADVYSQNMTPTL